MVKFLIERSLFCAINAMAANDLTMQGTKASVTKVLTHISQNIQVSASEGLDM